MTFRDIASKATRTWVNWTSFKLGVFVGGVLMALYMGVLIALPHIGKAILGAVQ